MPILGGGPNKGLDCEVERSSISTNSTSSSNLGSSSNFSSASASKLSKFGKRIRESCRNLKGKHVKSSGSSGPSHCPQEYTSLQLPNESVRSKVYVAMDFTGEDGGRVLDNPKDIRACDKSSSTACKDGYVPFRRRIATPVAEHLTEIQATIHKKQPWFHAELPREKANKILQAHANVDGVFLVRESSVAGGYVISYTFGGKHVHSQVLPYCCDEGVVYSVDDGRTKFYDLLQLVEFYQLNSGTLLTRLVHYIVRKDAIEKQKKTEAEPEAIGDNPASEELLQTTNTEDCAMSQDGVSEDDSSARDQQG